jgi:hypothetical protein
MKVGDLDIRYAVGNAKGIVCHVTGTSEDAS